MGEGGGSGHLGPGLASRGPATSPWGLNTGPPRLVHHGAFCKSAYSYLGQDPLDLSAFLKGDPRDLSHFSSHRDMDVFPLNCLVFCW